MSELILLAIGILALADVVFAVCILELQAKVRRLANPLRPRSLEQKRVPIPRKGGAR